MNFPNGQKLVEAPRNIGMILAVRGLIDGPSRLVFDLRSLLPEPGHEYLSMGAHHSPAEAAPLRQRF
jgi:hypothetical protein